MKRKSSKSNARAGVGESNCIICGTDFSERAQHAVRVAAATAKRLNEPVLLVHAVATPSLGIHADVLKLITASRREPLMQEVEEIRKAGVTVHGQSPPGRADQVLVSLACQGPTRFIVVSSVGRRGLEGWFLGSNADRTAQQATVPTLVVRDAEPFEAWTRGERPLKVFVAFNFTVTSAIALRWVRELQAIGPCEVVVGFVGSPSDRAMRQGAATPSSIDANRSEAQTVLAGDLKARVTELLGATTFRTRIEANWGRPDIRLADMAKEEGADLIVVGSHQYHGFERLWHSSVSRGLLHNAESSVAVVPRSANRKGAEGIAPPVQRVLVATDFSELANHAIPHAYSLLRGGGSVRLVYVHPEVRAEGEGSSDREIKARRAKKFQAYAEKLCALIPIEPALRGVTTKLEVVENDDAAEGICDEAERFGADIICLGTHGSSGLSKALLGSVVQQVMRRSRRPLLVIQPPVD